MTASYLPNRHQIELQSERLGDQHGDIRIGANHGLGVGRIGADRRIPRAGCRGEITFLGEFEVRRDRSGSLFAFFGVNAARLFGAQIEFRRLGDGSEGDGRQDRAEGEGMRVFVTMSLGLSLHDGRAL